MDHDPLVDVFTSPGNANAKPMDTIQRVIINNLFDTQPARRSAYLKKIGYEMNPKNDNEYRPLGSTGGFAEIDPGISAYFKKGGLAEIGKDIADVGFDTLVAGPLTALGGAAGAAGGGGILSVPAAILGGGAGNAAAEGIKKMAGDVLLDENVPIDKQAMVMQSIFSGIAPQLAKGAKSFVKQGEKAFFESRKEAIVNAIKQTGNGLNEEVLAKAIKDPEMFSRTSVDNASGKLKSIYKDIFGIDDPLKLDAPDNIRGGAFGKKMDVLNAQANSEIDRLGKEPAANFKFDDLANPIRNKISQLNDKFEKSTDEKAALSYLKDNLKDLESKVTPESSSILDQNGNPFKSDQREITFKDAREWLSAKQKDVSKKDTAGNYLNPAGNILAPAFGGKNGILSLLDNKAAQLGSDLPNINQQRSRVLQAYNTATEALTPQNITSAFVGADSPKKQLIQDASTEIDSVLGTQFTPAIENGAFQRVVENLYKDNKSFGSGPNSALRTAKAIQGGVKGALGGAAAGYATTKTEGGALIGGATGGALGAMNGAHEASVLSSPENALNALRSNSSKIDSLTTDLASPQQLSIPANLATQEVGRESAEFANDPSKQPIPDLHAKESVDVDPLADIFKK